MKSNMRRKMDAIKVAERRRVDTTRPNDALDTLRNRAMNATMDMIRGLSRVSDPETYGNVARGMMMIAMSTPIRCMCVGINPYMNGILPVFATALAYNPLLCDGVTPSIQVLSQMMSKCAIGIKSNFMFKHPDIDPNTFMDRSQYTARFAFMLRCSYACVEAGVAFVNASPVITRTTAGECMSVSLFSEWIARMVIIHNDFGYQIRVTSMGALSDEAIGDAMSAYPKMSSSMNLTRCVNPAMIARMNVKRKQNTCPIPDQPTVMETQLEMFMGGVAYSSPNARFTWNEYPDAIMDRYIGEDAVRSAVELLVDHAPDQLLNKFINTVRNTYKIMSDLDIASMMEGVGVSQDIDTGEYGRRGSDTDGYHPETVTAQGETSTKMFANPFAPSSTVGEPSGNRSTGDSGGQSGSGSGTGREGRGGFDGPVGALKRSQLGQLLDPTGKGVSQQVVVINSINQRANEIIMSYKQSTGDIVQIVQRQAQLMDRAGAAGMIDEAMRTEVEETCNMMMDFCNNMVTKMEEAYGFIEGLPAVIEGDMGIYVKETMPVAPLLRREDGSTMKQGIYGPVHRMAKMNNRTNMPPEMVSDPAPTQQTLFQTVDNSGPDISMVSATNLIDSGDPTYFKTASQALNYAIKTTDFGDGMVSKTVYNNLRGYMIKRQGIDTDLYTIICTIISERMSMTGGSSLTENELEGIVEMLGSGTMSSIEECESLYVDAVKNRTELEDFYNILNRGTDE